MTIDIPRTRLELGHWLNDHGLVGWMAEIGVLRGVFSDEVLRHWKGSKYVMVDPWAQQDPKQYRNITCTTTNWSEAYEQACEVALRYPQCTVMKMLSVDAARTFDFGTFDVVYIDGNHEYKYVIEDIESWWPKLKRGGVLCGHDFVDNRSLQWCEVSDAVRDWCSDNNYCFAVSPDHNWYVFK